MPRWLADIRPAERRAVLAAFATLFAILAGHQMLETARDALFLSALPATQLPWLYLAIAALALPLTRTRHGLMRWLQSRNALSILLVGSAAVTLAFWAAVSGGRTWSFYALYVWTGIFGTVVVLQFWLVLGDWFTVTQARRLYGFIGAGSVLGAVVGATAARIIAGVLPAPYLLPAGAGIFLMAALGPACLRGPAAGQRGIGRGGGSLLGDLRLVHGSPYLRRVGALVFLSTATVTLLDFLFKVVVADTLTPGELAPFFATVNIVLNGLALAAQLVLTGWLLNVIGLNRALAILPSLLLLGAGALVLFGGLAVALVAKGVDGALRHTVHRTGTELLFVPVDDEERPRVKSFIDVVGQRGGQGAASLAILAALAAGADVPLLSGVLAFLAAGWLGIALHLRPHYLNLFRHALRRGAIQTRVDLPAFDLASLETVIASLSSREDAEVLGALDLLAAQGRVRLIPALIVYHPSRKVVERALNLFAREGRTDFLPLADRLLQHDDPDVRAAALRARNAVEVNGAILEESLHDPSPSVSATALVGLIGSGEIRGANARRALADAASNPEAAARLALVRAMRRQPSEAFVDTLVQLSRDIDEDVRLEVARAMRAEPHADFFEPLLGMLAVRRLRDQARRALVEQGEPVLERLDRALGDRRLPHEIRRHLPRTISQFQPQAAADILLAHLLVETDGTVRFKILRGLGRLKADHPRVRLEPALLAQATEETLTGAFRLLDWRSRLEHGAKEDPSRATPVHELLVTLLEDKERHATERLFRLLGLAQPREDFERIYRGLSSDNARIRAQSQELLGNLLVPPLRDGVRVLVDELPGSERVARAEPFYRPRSLRYEDVVASILESASESLSALAAYHAGELGRIDLAPRIEALGRRDSRFLPEVAQRAAELLRAPTEEKIAYAG